MALNGKEELPVVPNAGGGVEELLLLLLFEKLKVDATGVGADEFDPAEKAKLFAAGVDVAVLLLVLPIPPKENGLVAVGAEDVDTEFVGADAADDAPNENGDEPAVALD